MRLRRVVIAGMVTAVVGSVLTIAGSGGPSTAPARPVAITEAPDALTAVMAARRQGTRVEVVDQGSTSRTVFAEPGGGFTAEMTAVPTRVRRDRSWVKIDTTMERRADGSVGPKAAEGDLRVSGGGDGPLATMQHNGKTLAWYWLGRLPEPKLDGDKATYHQVFPGVDLVMYADRNGFRQHLVIADAQAARNPALASIRLRMKADGLKVSVDDQGAIHAVDDSGTEVFSAPPSTMWDAAGQTAAVGISTVDSELVITPDQKFLADPALTYPVTVDPTPHTFGWNGWATVLSGKATTSYWKTSGEHPWAQVGQCFRDPAGDRCDGIGEAWAYFQFDTGWLWDKPDLMGATLDTSVVSSPNCTDKKHKLYHPGGDLWSTMTWNNKLQGGEIAEKWMPSVWKNCTGWKEAGIDIPLGHVEKHSPTVYYFRAESGTDQIAWRKLDPGSTKLRVKFNWAPWVGDLSTDPPLKEPCRWCGGESYVGNPSIRLMAQMFDVDDAVDSNWTVQVNNVNHETGWQYVGLQPGAVHSWNVDLTDKHEKRIAWAAAAGDRITWSGSWKWFPRAFNVDRVGVDKPPTVSAELYAQDNRWHGGPDVPDWFTFGANDVKDIDHYVYGWQDPPRTPINAESLGGSARVRLAPEGDGPQTLYVQSVDRAGHTSEITPYRFYVRAGNGPLAQWSMEGNAQDSAFLGDRHGTVNGATFAPGAVGASAQFDGIDDHVSAPNAVRNTAGFTVTAWVNPKVASGARAVVSQDGEFLPGFALWHRANPDGTDSHWSFGVPNSTTQDWGIPVAHSPAGMPQLNTWTHLAGVYDPEAKQVRIYANGVLVGTEVHTSNPGWASGPVRIGRTKWAGNEAVDHWAGGIDEVQIYDRVLSSTEIANVVRSSNVQVAHWKFDEPNGTTAHNTIEGGADGVLENGASFTGDGAVGGAVRLDGDDDVVSTAGPVVVRMDQSFSVAAHVKLDRVDGGTYTVLSQDGEKICGFCLQYQNNRWVFVLPKSDEDSPSGYDAVASSAPPTEGVWTHLVGVYDASAGKIRLYVDGTLVGEAGRVPLWQAKRAFRIGQAIVRGGPVQRLPGTIDEVRVYSRAISTEEVEGMVSTDNVTAGTWKLDGNANDANGRLNGALNSGPDWAAGQTSVPDPADLAVRLNGNGAHIGTVQSAVDTDKSFSVTAWARLDKPGAQATVVSQDGSQASGFALRALADGRWDFMVAREDKSVAGDQATGPVAVPGVWTHLVGVYSKERQQLELYVNGVLAASAPHNTGFDANGGLQIGRAKWNSNGHSYFAGAIDDVSIYSRPLFASEIKTMSGRDVSLGHNWTLDEGSGNVSRDTYSPRVVDLRNGATFGQGRVGNALTFDGVNDHAVGSGVDVRTDKSFSVATWVNLRANNCDLAQNSRCMLSAVSLDGGGATPKFRLGHVADTLGHPGNWVFEMPESSGTVTKAAVAVIPGDVNTWVHLVGVYNPTNREIVLYVNATRRGTGTLLEPWQASGSLRIGSGLSDGADRFWPGSVDDVRMYSQQLTASQVSALHRSYPAPAGSQTLPVADAGHWTFNENTGTTAADSSGRGLTATMRGGAGWHAGRDNVTGWFDGSTGYAETDGPVVDTSTSFSVAAWAYLSDATRDVVVFGQDGAQVGAFFVRYNAGVQKWSAVVPKADQTGTDSHYVLSAEPATVHGWTHLTLVYDVNLGQLRLYVNGSLSGVQVGVAVQPAAGKFSIGRTKWGVNTGFFPRGIDEVRAYHNKALSDGEVRRIHDDVPPANHGQWRFDDGTVRDYSWAQNPTTLTGPATFPAGVSGKALALNGSVSANATKPGVSMRDSFTVAAWAKLDRADRVATVLSQDGVRHSGFVLQYRPEVNRWIFGAPTHDADDADFRPMVYANSLQPPALGTWTHLAGIYDYPARQLRIYVNGELVGTRSNVLLWTAWGGFAVGRSKANDAPAGFFTGQIDDVTTDLGVVPDDMLRQRAGWSPPAGGQLGRFIKSGDHRSVNSSTGIWEKFGEVPAGYRFEGSLGMMLSSAQPGTHRLYSCLASNNDAFTSTDSACTGGTKLADLGWAYDAPPAGLATVPVHRCLFGQDRFDSLSSTCEGHGQGELLGYLVAYAPLPRYYHPRIGEHDSTIGATGPGYRYEGTFGLLAMTAEPGTVPLTSCMDGSDRFLSLDQGCGGTTVLRTGGRIWSQPPPGLPSAAIYQCALNTGPGAGELFNSIDPACENQTPRGMLGYVLRAVPGPIPA